MKQNNIVGLKELRENMESYIAKVKRGDSFVVVRKSKPIFRIAPADDEESLWETIVDFTKIKKGGVKAQEVLKWLQNG
jgi:prevent-host-death family protein